MTREKYQPEGWPQQSKRKATTYRCTYTARTRADRLKRRSLQRQRPKLQRWRKTKNPHEKTACGAPRGRGIALRGLRSEWQPGRRARKYGATEVVPFPSCLSFHTYSEACTSEMADIKDQRYVEEKSGSLSTVGALHKRTASPLKGW